MLSLHRELESMFQSHGLVVVRRCCPACGSSTNLWQKRSPSVLILSCRNTAHTKLTNFTRVFDLLTAPSSVAACSHLLIRKKIRAFHRDNRLPGSQSPPRQRMDSMASAAADSVDMGVFGFGLTEKTRRSLCLWWMREESRGTYRLVAGGIHGGAGRPGMGSYYLTVPPRARREGARSSRGPYRMWEWKVKMRHGSISNSEFAAARLERLASSRLRKLLAVQHMELT